MTINTARQALQKLDDIEPSSLDTALAHIEKIKDAMNEALDAFEARQAELQEGLDDATGRAEEAEEEARDALMGYLHDLACVHQKMKAGRTKEAIDDLDRVLQEADSGGAARMSAVAVML